MSDDLIAAVDLGSNSFHMVVGRLEGDRFVCLDRLRDSVRLASGLTPEGDLDEPSQKRALDALARFAERMREIPEHNRRIVGTNTLRKARNRDGFMARAQDILGHEIELISGVEEARLIYMGVTAAGTYADKKLLVVDIGGGSTEVIVGECATPRHLESLAMGCVTYSARYFPSGKLTENNFQDARTAAGLELFPVRGYFRRLGWDIALGTSGTAKALARICGKSQDVDGETVASGAIITRDCLAKLRDEMVVAGEIDKLNCYSVKRDRAEVLAGGVAIMQAVFDVLRLDSMGVSDSALREGIVFDLIGRLHHHDIRDVSIAALAQRFNADPSQSKRVGDTLARLFAQLDPKSHKEIEPYLPLLTWAIQVHEIGLSVAHQQYHKHGAYLLGNSDLPGFSNAEQQTLALLVRLHRRKLVPELLDVIDSTVRDAFLHSVVLLRLAVLLNRGRSDENEVEVSIALGKRQIRVRLTPGWEKERPLLNADLKDEQKRLANVRFDFEFS